MRFLNVRIVLCALYASTMVACLDLGTESPATGGAGGEGVTVGGNGGTGGGAVVGCKECNFGRRYGDDGEQGAFSLAMDAEGSVYLSGTYNGSMFLGPNVGLVDGNGDQMQAFLAKLDAKGVPQWIVNPDGFGVTAGIAGGVATENGIVAWGGGIGDDPILQDIFLETRTIAGGSKILARTTLGSQWHDELCGVALSSDGKTVYAAGVVRGSATSYAGCPMVAPYDAGANPNLVVMALDTMTLSCKWGSTFTGGNHNPGTIRVGVAADGNPVVTGAYSAGTLDNTGLPSGDGAFVVKLDAASGGFMLAKGFPNVLPLAMTVDRSTDRIVVTGWLQGQLTFAGTNQDAPIMPDTSNIAIMAYDSALNEKWFRPLAGSNGQFCQGISTNGAGRVFAGCIHQGSLALPNGPTLTCPPTDFMCGLLVTLNSADGTVFGDKCSTYGPEQPAKPGATFLTAANGKALVLGGSWSASITYPDGMPLPTIGSSTDYDVVVGKIDPAP